MLTFWAEELTLDQEDALIEKVATAVEKRKLTAPAIIALEMHKPLAYIGASAALCGSPFLLPFFGFDAVNDYTRFFQRRQNVERLLQRLERPPAKESA